MADEKNQAARCPSCGGGLERREIGGHSVMKCFDCGGLWLGREDIEALSEGRDETIEWPGKLDGYADEMKVESDREMACPTDGSVLVAVKYGHSEVIVDVCPRCAGVWLDKGEFEKISADVSDADVGKHSLEYLKDFMHELGDIFTGEKSVSEEFDDVKKTWHLFVNRLAIDHPLLRNFVIGAGESFA